MDDQASPLTFLIAGLGNPGREYRNTRHNIGFLAIDRLCAVIGAKLARLQSRALVGSTIWAGSKVVVAKPQTYMNLSGQSVAGLLHFYKIPISQLLVVHDEIDLPFGTLRLRPGGGSAGQKGLASIIQQLGTQDFPRLRLGIGRPPGQKAAADYVLSDFAGDDTEILPGVLDKAVLAIQTFVKEGLDQSMNLYNGPLLRE